MFDKILKVSSICVLSAMCICGSSTADVYRWTDSDGINHYSDNPPNSEKNSRHEIERRRDPKRSTADNRPSMERMSEEEQIRLYLSAFEGNKELSDRAKAYLFIFVVEGKITKEDILKIKTDEESDAVGSYLKNVEKGSHIDLSEIISSPNAVYSSPESTWSIYNNAIVNHDMRTALECLTPRAAQRLKSIFEVSRKEDIIKIGKNTISLDKVSMDSHRAEYRIQQLEEGKTIAYEIEFVKIFGNWKIEKF